jgi:hypothetical protein
MRYANSSQTLPKNQLNGCNLEEVKAILSVSRIHCQPRREHSVLARLRYQPSNLATIYTVNVLLSSTTNNTMASHQTPVSLSKDELHTLASKAIDAKAYAYCRSSVPLDPNGSRSERQFAPMICLIRSARSRNAFHPCTCFPDLLS